MLGHHEEMFQYPARYESRLLQPVLRRSGELGVRLVGGNAVGIFIHSVESQSPAAEVGLQSGDQVRARVARELSFSRFIDRVGIIKHKIRENKAISQMKDCSTFTNIFRLS